MDKKQKMVPKLRFPGFTDDWEQRKLYEIADKAVDNRGKTPTISEDGTHPLLEVASLGNGTPDYSKVTKYLSDETFETELRAYIKEGDILFSTVGSIGLVSLMDANENAAIAQNIVAFRANEKYDSKFLYAMLSTEDNQYKAQRIVMGAVQPSIKISQLVDVEYCVTENIDEQRKLGDFFIDLDNLITLHQRKLYQMKNYKQGLLQKMFPKNGEHIPEIRFPGFTDAWEQRKFDEWGDFYYGHSCPKWSVTEDATTPCIRYGELYTKFGAKIDKVYSYTNMPPEKLRFSKGTEVLIPRVGEDPMDYNHCTWLSLKGVAIGEMISVFNTDQDPLFSATMFNATLQKEFAIRVEGGSVTNLYFDKLRNIDISYPSLPEQKKIAAFFENIDNLITLHQRKLDQVKEYKKGLLQQMFV